MDTLEVRYKQRIGKDRKVTLEKSTYFGKKLLSTAKDTNSAKVYYSVGWDETKKKSTQIFPKQFTERDLNRNLVYELDASLFETLWGKLK
jgi:hypothetical protein